MDLNTLIDPLSGWELLDASAFNDGGQITGQGLIGGQYHAYLLTPIPIPGDFNLDSTVDAADYVVWRKGIDVAPTQDNYNTCAAPLRHDGQIGQWICGLAGCSAGTGDLRAADVRSGWLVSPARPGPRKSQQLVNA